MPLAAVSLFLSLAYLEISQLWECVHDDTEDDVQADCCDEDEEGEMKDDHQPELPECVFRRMTRQFLQKRGTGASQLNITSQSLIATVLGETQ